MARDNWEAYVEGLARLLVGYEPVLTHDAVARELGVAQSLSGDMTLADQMLAMARERILTVDELTRRNLEAMLAKVVRSR